MLAKRIAVVTGGNRGIGLEIARQLMKAVAFVVGGCRTEPLCLLPSSGPTGEFFRDRQAIPW